MSKVRVIELVGVKLDPRASYLFVINEAVVTTAEVRRLLDWDRESGKNVFENSMFLRCIGPPDQAVKVFEIPAAKRPAQFKPAKPKDNLR